MSWPSRSRTDRWGGTAGCGTSAAAGPCASIRCTWKSGGLGSDGGPGRGGEVVGLEWGRVTLEEERGVFTFPPKKSKNKKPRTLVLTGDLLALIERRAALRVPACPLVFHRAGRPLRDFRTAWRLACDA